MTPILGLRVLVERGGVNRRKMLTLFVERVSIILSNTHRCDRRWCLPSCWFFFLSLSVVYAECDDCFETVRFFLSVGVRIVHVIFALFTLLASASRHRRADQFIDSFDHSCFRLHRCKAYLQSIFAYCSLYIQDDELQVRLHCTDGGKTRDI